MGTHHISVYSFGDARNIFDNSVTNHIAPMGDLFDNVTNEPDVEVRVRTAFTLKDFLVRAGLGVNSLDSATTVRSRVNGANGNLSVSIPALASGDFEDTVNEDSLSVADDFNTQIVTGGSMTQTISMDHIAYNLENTAGDKTIVGKADPSAPHNPSTTEFFSLFGNDDGLETARTDVDYLFRVASTFENLRCFITQNNVDGASTITLHINGANGNSQVSIPANTTGEIEDTVNSDSMSSGDRASYEIVTGLAHMAGDTLTWSVIHIEQDAGGSRTTVVSTSSTIAAIVNGANRNTGLEGSPRFHAASFVEQRARAEYTCLNYFVRMKTNTLNASTTIGMEENGSVSALSVSFAASTSGDAEDTVDEVVVEDRNTFNHNWDASGSSSGNGNPMNIGLEIRSLADAMSWYPSAPPAMERIVEVLAY